MRKISSLLTPPEQKPEEVAPPLEERPSISGVMIRLKAPYL